MSVAQRSIGVGAAAVAALAACLGLMLCMLGSAQPAHAQEAEAKVLIFSGTTGYRHSGGSGQTQEAIQPDVVQLIQDQLADAGIESDYHSCNGTGTGGGALPGCRNAQAGVPAVFTEENLAQYDAIFFWQASSQFRGQPNTGPLFNAAEQQLIEDFANNGGGIAAMHASVTMSAGDVTWPWWDAPGDTAVGALMPGHSATDINNVATVQVSDRHHPSTKDLPDEFELGDEHYTFSSNPRGTHHILATLDEETYDVGNGVTRMGADHPIAWCRMYEGARIWTSSFGHFAATYRENGGDNNLMKHLIGGVKWVAGVEGRDSDCGGTVWTNFTRTVLETDLQGAIGMDIAEDGKVYWTEIGVQGINSEGRLRMWDPETDETQTLLTIPTRADYPSSNGGVLGMALDPDFAENRRLYIYYSPRVAEEDSNCAPKAPNCVANNTWIMGHNVVSRFTLNAEGDEVVPGSEQEILRVPSVKVGNNNNDGTGQSTYGAHLGGGSLSFDSEGNLYLGTGDDVDPFMGSGHNYAPIDGRFPERYDARNTSANTNDLRGKILRIKPLSDASGEPGAGTTYEIPEGNMFEPGTDRTKPEIYAMGFRNPFTVHADPNDPGTVVVGEYGPDAGSDSATYGPAGVIEWDRVDEPGFYGWPLCVGDNATNRSYFKYDFATNQQGERYDCSAAQIPNDSPNNSGLENIPGPAVGADVWAKHGGGTPARFGIPGTANEAATGPVYRFDPDNPSETKWPRYFDGSWLIFNRASNWWREVRVKDDGSEILRVNELFPANQFGNPAHNYVIPTRFGPDGALYLITWSGGCCRSSLPGIGVGQLMRIDFIGDQDDVTPPVVTASLSGYEVEDGVYANRATLRLEATDTSGIDSIEYRVNGGEWTEYTGPVVFDEEGNYTVDYRATDNSENSNTSEVQTLEFSVFINPACVPQHSDEFDGSALDERWSFRHPTTPANGAGAPSVSGGALNLPLGSYSVDLERPGPIGFIGQPLPEDDFVATAKISAPGLDADNGGGGSKYAQVGLKLFQDDDNWIKVAHNRNADSAGEGSRPTYFELAYEDNGGRTLGTRTGAGSGNLPTWWFQIEREGNSISARYSLTDPDGPGGATWVNLPANPMPTLNGIFDTSQPIYIGPYAGNGSITAQFDYIRFEPDGVGGECEIPSDTTPPTTFAMLHPGDPGPGGTYETPVTLHLSATDDGGFAGLVTEYRVNGGEWQTYELASPPTFSDPGAYEIEYRSTDKAGNVEEPKTISFQIAEPATPEPSLKVAVQPKKRNLAKRAKKTAFKVNLRNRGDGAAGKLRVCAKAPKARLAVKGKACRAVNGLDAGAKSSVRFVFKVKKGARGKTSPVRFDVRGAGKHTVRAKVKVRK